MVQRANPLDRLSPEKQLQEVFFWGMKMHHRAEDLEIEVGHLRILVQSYKVKALLKVNGKRKRGSA